MTVSLRRLIAYVALVAISLAGTPHHTLANDGLKLERFGFKSKKQDIRAAKSNKVDLTRNPLRESQITATLTGAAIEVDRAYRNRQNLALLKLDQGVAISSERLASQNSAVEFNGTVRGAVFQNSNGFHYYFSIMRRWSTEKIGQMASVAGRVDEQFEVYAKAERQFLQSLTAAATGYGVLPVRPIQKPRRMVALTGVAKNNASSEPMVPSTAVLSAQPCQLEPGRSTLKAVVRNVASRTIKVLRPTNQLSKPNGGCISIDTFEIGSLVAGGAVGGIDKNSGGDTQSGGVGRCLLIDRYIPSCLEKPGFEPQSLPNLPPVAPISIPSPKNDNAGRKAARSGDGLTTISFRSLDPCMPTVRAAIRPIEHIFKPTLGWQNALWVTKQLGEYAYHSDFVGLANRVYRSSSRFLDLVKR